VPLGEADGATAGRRVLARMAATAQTVRLKVYSEKGSPGAAFRPASGVLEDAYFSLVGEAGGRA
jgi:hypothetical protein